MKIGILTSSRADFGIYTPLIYELWNDSMFNVELIVFGTHLSEKHGYTISEIESSGYTVAHKITTDVQNEFPGDISCSIGNTTMQFSKFWAHNNFDLVFALGDRYEMFAAVSAASPFNIDIAHIHAGETTLGAIDNAYRHAISLMSKYQFVTASTYKKRTIELTRQPNNVFDVGALSIDNLVKQKFLSKMEFQEQFGISLNIATILSTFHPETVDYKKNEQYIKQILLAFDSLRKKYQIVVTMPNSDTMGDMIRQYIQEFSPGKPEIFTIESFGMRGYLTCMKHCSMMVGNTSSGFVEAAFFPTVVVNIGNRQKGRIKTENIISCPIEHSAIINAVKEAEGRKPLKNTNIYGNGNTAKRIKDIIKKLYGNK